MKIKIREEYEEDEALEQAFIDFDYSEYIAIWLSWYIRNSWGYTFELSDKCLNQFSEDFKFHIIEEQLFDDRRDLKIRGCWKDETDKEYLEYLSNVAEIESFCRDDVFENLLKSISDVVQDDETQS